MNHKKWHGTETKNILKSIALLLGGGVIGSGSSLLIYLLLARELEVEYFGLFGATLSLLSVAAVVSTFGIFQFWLKEFGKDGYAAYKWLKPTKRFILYSLIISILIITLYQQMGGYDKERKIFLYLMSFFLIDRIAIEFITTKFQLEESYGKIAIIQFFSNFSRLLALIIIKFTVGIDLVKVGYIYGISSLLTSCYALYQCRKFSYLEIDLKGSDDKVIHSNLKLIDIKPSKVSNLVLGAWPFGLASMFAYIYVQSDIVMVKLISGDISAGIYNVGFIVLTAIGILPTVIYQKYLLPKYHRWANHNKSKFYHYYTTGNNAMLVIGIIMMGLLYWLSPYLVMQLFGEKYLLSIGIIEILAFAIPAYFLSYNIAATLVTRNHMLLKVKIMGAIAALNILLNLLLIPLFGANGAAISTVISYIVLAILYYYAASKVVFSI